MTELFGFWKYNSFVPLLQTAVAEKNTEDCISTLWKMLVELLVPWDTISSPLFYRIVNTADPKQILPAILTEMEQSPEYDFLRDCDEFKELLVEYKAQI